MLCRQGRASHTSISSGRYRKYHTRHPLQELVVDAFVPNDAHLVGGVGLGQPYEPIHDSNAANDSNLNSIVLCTGANACGKVGLPQRNYWMKAYLNRAYI